jgi:class 3 adenylate cyclase
VTATEPDVISARDAAATLDWPTAFETLAAADARSPLAPEDLEVLAKAAWWTGRSNASIDARERAYAGYIDRGDTERAAFCALTLRREYNSKLSGSVAQGWLTRAERLLGDDADTVAHGYLAVARAEAAAHGGDVERALELLGRASAIAGVTGERDLLAWAAMREGELRFAQGEIDEGWKLLEEVAVAAVGGELGPYTTGAAFCNMIQICRDRADYGRGREWGDAAKRWCERQAISGFPGVCRVRRAEIMRLLGSLTDAEREIRQACDELPEFMPYIAGEAFHELGEVRLRMGDLDEAEEAFRQARGFGADPQPGSALLLLARGNADAAAASIAHTLEEHTADRLGSARLLPAAAEIALARRDHATVAAAVARLESIEDEVPTTAMHANAELLRGIDALLAGDTTAAAARFRAARQTWREIDAAFEGARATALLAEALEAGGDRHGALVELETARGTFDRLGAALDEDAAGRRIASLGDDAAAPARTVDRALMFTDIVASTALLEAIGDEAWTDLRRWHDQALRRCVASHGGEEVDHTGDGFFLAFEDTSAAVACATQIQRTLAEHRRDHGFAPQVRIGIHAADAVRTGENYTGRGVHTAARVGAVAGAGEIVASASSVEALPGITTSNPRTVDLKGIAEPVAIVSIDWRDGS